MTTSAPTQQSKPARSYVDGEAQRCLIQAERARDRFYARRRFLEDQVASRSYHARRHGTSVDVIVDRYVARDPECQAAVADNRWFMAQADMYSGLRRAEQAETLLRLVREQVTLLREVRDALRDLTRSSGGESATRSDAVVA